MRVVLYSFGFDEFMTGQILAGMEAEGVIPKEVPPVVKNPQAEKDAVGIAIEVLTSSVMTEEEARQALFEMQKKGVYVIYNKMMEDIVRGIG